MGKSDEPTSEVVVTLADDDKAPSKSISDGSFDTKKKTHKASKCEIMAIFFMSNTVLFYIFLADIIGVISGGLPIYLQNPIVHEGAAMKFGGPKAFEHLIDIAARDHGVDMGLVTFNMLGPDLISREDVIDFNSLRIDFAGWQASRSTNLTYTEVFAMATAMNEAQIATGSCKGPPMECTPFTTKTRAEMRKWIAMEETACMPDDDGGDLANLDFLFHNCMRFSPHNPGSMYILSGSAVYEHNLDCRYTQRPGYSLYFCFSCFRSQMIRLRPLTRLSSLFFKMQLPRDRDPSMETGHRTIHSEHEVHE